MSSSAAIAYLNGDFLPLEAARVPVTDRGFLFGDGVYEVVPVYAGRPYRLARHLGRLGRSLDAIRLAPPLEPAAWERLIAELVERNGGGDLSLYLQVTRGASLPRDHAFPADCPPTVFASATALRPAPAELATRGIAAVTAEDLRWQACHIKAITLLANVLARQQAVDQGAGEAILVRDGLAVEGAASNLFAVIDGELLTPPAGPWLLGGITREAVLELAAAGGIPARESDIPVERLTQAEELWLTSSTREILPVTRLDGRPVGDGRPGPLWQRMTALYDADKRGDAAAATRAAG